VDKIFFTQVPVDLGGFLTSPSSRKSQHNRHYQAEQQFISRKDAEIFGIFGRIVCNEPKHDKKHDVNGKNT
jgi:hypothetical protein